MHCNAPGGQIFYFQNTFDSDGDEIRMEIQTENFFGNLILTRLKDWPEHMYRDLFLFYNLVKITLPKTMTLWLAYVSLASQVASPLNITV
jgi:hypothetical protein